MSVDARKPKRLTPVRVAALQGAAAGALLAIFASDLGLVGSMVLCAAVLALLAYGAEVHNQNQLRRISALEAQTPKRERQGNPIPQSATPASPDSTESGPAATL